MSCYWSITKEKLTLFFSIFHFDPPENIKKPKFLTPMRTCPCAYRRVRKVRFLMFSEGSKGNTRKERTNN